MAIVRGDHAAGRVRMNRTDLQQVLINLFADAIHATPHGGTLSISSAVGAGARFIILSPA
ncbi:hypothetical protein [Azospirillum picis]|uniref:Signal transduction histidine kinase n=1 Tax=Azospirillum picis TaxID=488438 RepID=A0ABU0MUK9_9PROT|nr:hypothetical protein [Azospirillum picis]MBP2303265.1 signal transduction histidine kinase [Azospirillum picis]MDQ0537111.1 signal transduction histidine kinase [Azospirillum picis]